MVEQMRRARSPLSDREAADGCHLSDALSTSGPRCDRAKVSAVFEYTNEPRELDRGTVAIGQIFLAGRFRKLGMSTKCQGASLLPRGVLRISSGHDATSPSLATGGPTSCIKVAFKQDETCCAAADQGVEWRYHRPSCGPLDQTRSLQSGSRAVPCRKPVSMRTCARL